MGRTPADIRFSNADHRRLARNRPGTGPSKRPSRARQVLATARMPTCFGNWHPKMHERHGQTVEMLRSPTSLSADRSARRWSRRCSSDSAAWTCSSTTPASAHGHFAEADEERLRQIFEVNFFGLAGVDAALLCRCSKQGTTPAVVNISSIVGKHGLPGRSEYSASKFAVQGLSEALRPSWPSTASMCSSSIRA